MSKPKKNIKSTKVTLKFSNTGKKEQLYSFIDEYRNVVTQFVDILWETEKIPKFLEKDITSQISSCLSARAICSAGKQASGIVRGTREKQRKRLYMINKLTEEGKTKKAKKLQKIYDNVKVSKPNIDIVEPELDAKFIKLDLENNTSFDGWLTLASLGYKFKIIIPFKKSKHFNKLLLKGKLKTGVRLSKSNLTFSFELPKKEKKESGIILGIDIGQTTLLSCSNNQVSEKDIHGHDLASITSKLIKKKKGSKGFAKVSNHRTNYINWSVKQLNFENVNQLRIENIKYLRKGKRSSRKLSHWNYKEIFDKLHSHCEDLGVQVITVNPTYTSQRCSSCGWTRKSNRKGKLFKCGNCGFATDSDLNASKNIALPDLLTLGKSIRLEHPNKKGFFWLCSGQELRVPVVQKAFVDNICL